MSELTPDLQELEKLSPNPTRRAQSHTQNQDTQCQDDSKKKWRILLEPALAGSMIAINLGQTSLQNFYLRTACTVDLGYPAEICVKGVGEEFRTAEAASQVVVAGVNISRSFIGSLISAIVLLFVGPWSDCSGRRKPLLIMPLVGMTIMTTGVLLMIMFPGASTIQVLYVVQIPISLGGNFGLLLAAAFSHIGDVCHATGRDVTRTMGEHRAAIQISQVVGAVCGPLLYRNLGFYGVFPLVLLLQVSSLLYVIFAVKDVNINNDNKVSVLNWKLPFNAFQCLVRKRDGYRRTIIFLLLIVTLGDRIFLSAEILLSYMYYRYKFHWDDVLFGGFLAYRNIVSFFGTLIILSVLKRRLQLSDETVGALSCATHAVASSGLIAATTTIAVFIVPVVGIISQGSQVVQRPLINKQILPNEQGKIYSVLGALESATQTISSPLYSLLYSRTVSTMPDAWLLPGIGIAILQVLAYLSSKRLAATTIENNVAETKSIQLKTPNDASKLRKDDEPDESRSLKIESHDKNTTTISEK
ncbi:proton-coupled folate transporter-like isoform X2 [Galleria mellonella]|uniref:Proton-coupled folate transporter-like isoform X2 n=1 Tax=Galleria mellonella TaxID=7137 RepID=A0ABM3MC04_GALME|nr:proton-coupled folate transporter-like isoform X2 [Galleria mellonella]